MALTPQQASVKKLGSYELIREVSASSVGATFIARTKDHPESVVLTKVHRHVAKSPQLCENFLSESKKAESLSHPNVCRVREAGTVDGEPYSTHAYHESETLLSLLRRIGPEGLALPIATRILLDSISAIEAAYATEVGHGELGPWCIHVGQDGTTRVSGFGVDRALARFGLHFAKNLDRLPYASPERVKPMSLTLGPAPPTPVASSDLFSLAVIGWELLTRSKLFASRMEAAIVQKVLSAPVPEVTTQRPEVPAELSRAMALALSRDAAARGTLADLAGALTLASPATPAEVAAYVAGVADKAAPKSGTTARAFTSGVPGPASVRPLAPKGNGPPAKPPIKPRAHTLMGMAPLTAPAVPKGVKPIEDEPTLDLRADTAVELRDSSVEILMEEPSTQDGNELVETVETATTLSLKQPSTPPLPDSKLESEQASEPPAVAEVAKPKASSVPPPMKAPSVPPPPLAARRRPPVRQHTLMGIEPAVAESASATDDEPAKTPSPQPAVTTAATSPTAPEPAPRAEDARPLVSQSLERGSTSVGPGLIFQHDGASYQLIDAVARGGMATVWAARRPDAKGIDDLVAVKTVLPELSDDPNFATMFQDEIRVVSRIDHPNVAQTLDCITQDDAVFLVMEWIDGDTLAALQTATRTSGGIPENILVRIAQGVCDGLHAAHELRDANGAPLDLVHRDVNPTNLMVTRAGQVKIVDFGIAKSKGRLHVTRAGSTVKGKAPYLSPEQLGGIQLDRRSDLFSLGCVLYTLATGVHPFRGDSELKTIENIVLKTAANPRGLAPELHAEFETLILQLLEKDLKKRPASAAAVKEALLRVEALMIPASDADVGAFVAKALAEPLRERDAQLKRGIAKLAPKRSTPPPPPRGEAPKPDLEPNIPAPPAVLTVASIEGADTTSEPEASLPVQPAIPVEEATEASAPALEPTLPLAAAGSVEPSPVDDVPAASGIKKRPMSPWMRLGLLVVVGVLVGVGIIALIESMRAKPDPKPPVTTTASARPPSTGQTTTAPTQAPTAVPVPTATATATATAEPTVTAEPTAEPTSQPEPSTTQPPSTPKPSRTGKPSGTGKPFKPKPPKYNPSTI